MFEFVVYIFLWVMFICSIIGLCGIIFYLFYLLSHPKEYWDYIKKSDPMDYYYYGYTHGHDSGSSD